MIRLFIGNWNLKIDYFRNGSSGQVALVVLLISAVTLTLGLSLTKKTTVETRIETDEESLKQAFNAAESGVDYYLSTGTTQYISPDSRSQADVVVSDIGGEDALDFNEFVVEGYYMNFWLVDHNDDGSINYGDYYSGSEVDICVLDSFSGSLLINYYYRDGGGSYLQKRYATNFGGAQVISNPSSLGVGSCQTGWKGMRINTQAVPLLVAISPIFVGARINLEEVGGNTFPIQGQEIASKGVIGEVSRRVTVVRRYKIPDFMMEALTSGGQILN